MRLSAVIQSYGRIEAAQPSALEAKRALELVALDHSAEPHAILTIRAAGVSTVRSRVDRIVCVGLAGRLGVLVVTAVDSRVDGQLARPAQAHCPQGSVAGHSLAIAIRAADFSPRRAVGALLPQSAGQADTPVAPTAVYAQDARRQGQGEEASRDLRKGHRCQAGRGSFFSGRIKQ